MENTFEKLFKLAGDSNKFQYILGLIVFIIWINVSFLSVSIGLLEKSPNIIYYHNSTGKYIQASLNSTICKWNKNYTITKNYTHSVTTSFNIDCDSFKIGLVGSLIFIGNLIGSFLFQYLVEKFGRKKTIVLISFPLIISIIILSLSYNYYQFVIFTSLAEAFCTIIAFASFLLCSEITSSKSRSIITSIINSAFCICGIIYTLLYEHVGNWRNIFVMNTGVNILILIPFIFYSVESYRFYLGKNDYESFIESLKIVAKKNDLEEEFNSKINDRSTEEYEACNQIERFMKKRSNKIENKKEIEDKNLREDEEINLMQNNTENNNSDRSLFDLIKYPSIRTKFLSLCFIWFTSAGSYYGLNINIKNLSGDLYKNSIINYTFEAFIYIFGGFLINLKCLGRKYTIAMFYTIAILAIILHCFIPLSQSINNLVLLIARMCIAGIFVYLFTYTVEIYPSPVRAMGFGLNSAISKFAPVIVPFIVEIIPEQIFLIYLLMNIICLIILLSFMPETLGEPLKEFISEEEDRKIK